MNLINIVLTDGEIIIVTRYRNSSYEESSSLYFYFGLMLGEKVWDLDNVEGLVGFDCLVDRDIYRNMGGLC